jgi:4-hydroxyphenylpyruvate dioxygenase-like putative hemolysin
MLVKTTVEFSVLRPLDLLPSRAFISPQTEIQLTLLEKNKKGAFNGELCV